MTKQNFIDDLQKIYDYLDNEKAKTNELLKFLENKEFDKLFIIDDFSIVAIADFNIDGFKSTDFFQSCIENSKSSLFSILLDIARIIKVSLLFWL